MLTVVLMILHAVGSTAYAAFGISAAIASSVMVAAISIFSARMAGRGHNAWFLVPAVIFTGLPLAGQLWTLTASEQSWWRAAAGITPFLTGFAGPVLLLLAAYASLAGRRGYASPL